MGRYEPHENSWIELIPSGTSLTVKVKDNTVSEPRSTYIIVTAGAATVQKVKVTQDPASINLSLSPDAINVPVSGGLYTVDISSSNDLWEVELASPADWVTMKVHRSAKLAILTVAENTTTEERQVAIRATNKNETVEVLIKQSATTNARYIVPLLKNKPTGYEIIKYEMEKKGMLKSFIGAMPEFGMTEDAYTFVNVSELFPETEYYVDVITKALIKVEIESSDYKTVFAEKQQIIDFYKSQDFEFDNEEGNLVVGRHKELAFEIQFKLVENKGAVIHFVQYSKQTKEYPTLDKMPVEPQHYFNSPDWKLEQIEAAEMADGATDVSKNVLKDGPHKGQVSLALFKQAERKIPLLITGYFFAWAKNTPEANLGQVEELLYIYNDATLGFWKDIDVTGQNVMTNEFKALLKKEGWVFYKISRGNHYYYNKAKKLMLAAHPAAFTDINDGKPILQMNFYPYELEGSSKSKAQIDKELDERAEKWEKTKRLL